MPPLVRRVAVGILVYLWMSLLICKMGMALAALETEPESRCQCMPRTQPLVDAVIPATTGGAVPTATAAHALLR